MRVVPLFIAITLIGCVFAEPAAKPKNEIVTAVHKAGEALSKIQLKSPFASFTGKQEMHAFKAEQSSSCDLTAYSTATATALQSCPGLVKVMAGTGTALEFLPGFCGSDCHKAIVAQMPKLAGCDGYSSTVRTMQELVKGCATKPRCYTEAFLKTQDSLEKRCSNEIDAITNFNNFTAAGVNATRSACQGTCITEVAAAMRTYPECVTDSDSTVSPTAMASLMEGLCQQENGEYCGVRMKAIGKLSCSSGSACYSSTSSLSWCSLNNPYSLYSCTPVVNDERLSSFCGSCVANLQKNAAAFGDNADTVVSSLNLYCSLANGTTFNNVTNPYCYPLAMNAYNVVNSWYQPSNSTVASACAGAASQCAELTLNVAADIATSAAKKSFASCLYGYSSGSYCQSTYESSLRSAATSRAFAARVCAQNDKKDWCVTSLNNVYNAYSYCSYLGTASYRTALNTSIAAAGCCMGYYNDFQRYSSYSYAASYLPSGTRVQPYQTYQYTTSSYTTATKLYNYTHPTLYSRSTIRRDEQPANQLFYCLSTTGNTTDFWNVVEKQCTTTYLASPPTASVPVMISWTRISRNPAVKAAVEAAMRSDVAKAIGVALRSIVNGTLIENAAATIYLRNESTLSRRQAQTTDHGATYQFQVDQPTSADATAAIARLNSQVSAGTFVTTSTSATVQTQCGECIDSRSDSLIKSAETPATPAPVGISSPSSAGAVAVASAVAAAFALVAAL